MVFRIGKIHTNADFTFSNNKQDSFLCWGRIVHNSVLK